MKRDRVGISEQNFYHWTKPYVGLEVDQFRQLKQLQEVDHKSRADHFINSLTHRGTKTRSCHFDHRNRFVTNFVYRIPYQTDSKGWMRTAFGDWQLGGIWTLQSGSPFTVNLSTDTANNGQPTAAPSQRPNLVCNPNAGPKTPSQWFNTACFQASAAFTYGNANRDIVIGPGLDDFDATLQKEFPVQEDMKLQFRLDIFDFFNHPNFNAPIGAGRTFSTSTSFGQITSAQDPREMQFLLRLEF